LLPGTIAKGKENTLIRTTGKEKSASIFKLKQWRVKTGWRFARGPKLSAIKSLFQWSVISAFMVWPRYVLKFFVFGIECSHHFRMNESHIWYNQIIGSAA
jgi:hypothetical protein